MVASKNDYVHLLHELLPRGLAFPRDDFTSPFGIVIDIIAEECAALDAKCEQLFIESDPRTATQSFAEWLTDWGVPNECIVAFTDGEITQQNLRRELIIKASRIGGQSAKYFEDLTAAIGRTVKITDLGTAFHFQANIDYETDETEATVLMSANDPLKSFGDALAECLIRRIKPAHTDVEFAYSLNVFNLLADNGNNLLTDGDDNIVARVVG